MTMDNGMKNAKEAYDFAWAQATKYGNEALEALEMHERVQARDTDDIFMQKAKRALTAYENWRKAADLAVKVMDEHYKRLSFE